MKIAVFGSAFNPPSLGHKSVIERLGHFDRVLLVPSIAHAWGKTMLSFDTRVEMLNEFAKDLIIKNVEISTLEKEIHIPDQSVTTFSLLNKLQENEKNADITFIIGPDNLLQFAKFHKSDEIVKRWSVMACPETVAIRSTDIRNAIGDNMEISHLTTPHVADYIKKHRLYE
ncbi:nicotinate-nicotinamide nucleotide adenylyltransferase [Aliivibrio fischeri]|uniref:nicotinate-nicotinamide nucleotide adenylyltransferase n=1 Tax=Aliivibrio fischeri TaxID=668 RepID=UPI0007C4338D|nr:nicotinate-nicotinamide nucleotide adenylyltransferase [Aliivibrio fischeri]MBP3140275.1 nicotinate-nicotinamide nucleotide adenylyltransferase [Aliivibrio fischeri]MBP3154660.1 nicotinate-nicotinamide nucleotide adenylyltransferase [Aliivibrio fischeri]MCE7575667.1 nicotinate-nicotinamide nucleotide adenylyltransferase [Aliivibrio fischeri]